MITKTKFDIFSIEVTVNVSRSFTLVSFERVYKLGMHAKYEVPTSYGLKVMAKVKVFRYVGLRSRSRSLGHNFLYDRKGIIKRNIHVIC